VLVHQGEYQPDDTGCRGRRSDKCPNARLRIDESRGEIRAAGIGNLPRFDVASSDLRSAKGGSPASRPSECCFDRQISSGPWRGRQPKRGCRPQNHILCCILICILLMRDLARVVIGSARHSLSTGWNAPRRFFPLLYNSRSKTSLAKECGSRARRLAIRSAFATYQARAR
jgi:hypothetical protein